MVGRVRARCRSACRPVCRCISYNKGQPLLTSSCALQVQALTANQALQHDVQLHKQVQGLRQN